jgi:hypothetical protein
MGSKKYVLKTRTHEEKMKHLASNDWLKGKGNKTRITLMNIK